MRYNLTESVLQSTPRGIPWCGPPELHAWWSDGRATKSGEFTPQKCMLCIRDTQALAATMTCIVAITAVEDIVKNKINTRGAMRDAV